MIKTSAKSKSTYTFRLLSVLLFSLAAVLISCLVLLHPDYSEVSDNAENILVDLTEDSQSPQSTFNDRLIAFAEANNLPLDSWPEFVLELPELNAETEEYVLNYPILAGKQFDIDLSEYCHTDSVPLLMQWDERWGYTYYAEEPFGVSGCGPTCLAMVGLYLRDDVRFNPKDIAEFSTQQGYSVANGGSSWTLISEGGPALGLDITEIPLDRQRIIRNLEAHNPIICAMGPGAFTTTGHFIVLTGIKDGKITVNDPNSYARSQQLWDYSVFSEDIQNLWVCR